MAYKYDPARMKSGAESVEKARKKFDQARENIDNIMASVPWHHDETAGQFFRKYNREAKESAKELSEVIEEFSSLLKQCSKKYANAIDNGNANLSV